MIGSRGGLRAARGQWGVVSTFTVRLLLLTSLVLVPSTAQLADLSSAHDKNFAPIPSGAAPNDAVWFADHHVVSALDVATNQIAASLPLPDEVSGLVIDPNDHSLWVLAHHHLQKFDAQTSLVFDQDLPQLAGPIEDPRGLTLDPYDGSVWVYADKALVHVDHVGTLISRTNLSQPVRSLVLGLERHRLWEGW